MKPHVEKIPPDTGKYISSGYYNSYTKAIIGLKDNSVLHVNQITTYNNEVRVEYNPKKIPLNPMYTFPVANIRYIKFKREAFIMGLVAGGAIGAILGAVYGEGSYKYDFTLSEYDNDESMKLRKFLYGSAGAVPLGLVGGIIGSIVIKKTFFINGDRAKLNKIIKRT